MKYFTLDGWIQDQGPDFDAEDGARAIREYAAYIESVRTRLPPDFLRLLDTIQLHDARLREMAVDARGRTASLRLDAGDITMREGRDVTLHYGGSVTLLTTADPSRGLPGPHGFGDLGMHEFEVLDDGLFEHRFLFSSGIELSLRFETFRLAVLGLVPGTG